MFKYFVYLKKSENRIIITDVEINDYDYHHLMDNNGSDENLLKTYCNVFCLGYYVGVGYGIRPINDPSEFQ